jgi:hypothetical protein
MIFHRNFFPILTFGEVLELLSKQFLMFAFSEGVFNIVGFTAFRLEEHPWI